MEKIFDYAGNEIKEGDEFVFIKILDRTMQGGYLVPATGESVWFDKIPDKECFEICDSHKVIVCEETMNKLGYCLESEFMTFYNTLSAMIAFSALGNTPRTTILAIKGISDTKEYYDKWKQTQKIMPQNGKKQ